jgi:NAD(P)-dependent dehydrogenase (short-subunit alcohol dehydrogenase family)
MSPTALSTAGESGVVTGAGRGIGRRIAASLVEAGVDVAVNDIDDEALGKAERELDGADDDVNVTAVRPGSVAGSRLDAVIEGRAASQGRPVEDIEAEFRSASPVDEFVTAEDVADAVLVLCSERSRRMTGQDLNVTAGIVMH